MLFGANMFCSRDNTICIHSMHVAVANVAVIAPCISYISYCTVCVAATVAVTVARIK